MKYSAPPWSGCVHLAIGGGGGVRSLEGRERLVRGSGMVFHIRCYHDEVRGTLKLFLTFGRLAHDRVDQLTFRDMAGKDMAGMCRAGLLRVPPVIRLPLIFVVA